MVVLLVSGMLAAALSVHLGPALYGRPQEVQQRTSTPEGALKKGSKVCISPAINNEVIMLITTGGNHQDKRVAKQRDPRKSATQDQRLFAVWFSLRTNMQAGVSPEVLKLQFTLAHKLKPFVLFCLHGWGVNLSPRVAKRSQTKV